MPVIALIKQPAGRAPDPYAAAFEAAGWETVVVAPLEVTLNDLDRLAAVLATPDRWAGLVLTSPRAAEAVAAAGLPDGWAGLPAWAVGAETARRARALGMRPEGADAGDAATLAERIVAGRGEETRPLLFPCGDRRREELPARLSAAGVPFEPLVVYRVHLRRGPLLPPDLRTGWAAFFSPSGVAAARADAAFPWDDLHALAIGPTTAEALLGAGRSPLATAVRPTPEALVEAAGRAARTLRV